MSMVYSALPSGRWNRKPSDACTSPSVEMINSASSKPYSFLRPYRSAKIPALTMPMAAPISVSSSKTMPALEPRRPHGGFVKYCIGLVTLLEKRA